MRKFGVFISFAVGAAIGTAVTWYYTKQKYEQIAQEEIDSVKEVFCKKANKKESDDSAQDKNDSNDEIDIMEYSKKLKENGYIDYSNIEMSLPDVKIDKTVKDDGAPYVISPDEFGEDSEYETISLTYYADQILADDMDELIDDVEDCVGFDALNHFGEYEEDSVFVRNDRRKIDYEILLDLRRYEDVIAARHHMR